MRFELAMCERRRWDAATFRALLAPHPFVRHLVKRLVWATYADGQLTHVFRVAEDGTLADSVDEAFTLPATACVGIAHALEMDEPEAATMAQVFADYRIIQPFAQLGRDVHRLTDDEQHAWTLRRWTRQTVSDGRVLGLDARGWRRGPAAAAGFFCEMLKRLPNDFEARLAFSPGIQLGSPRESPEQTLEEVCLYAGTGSRAAIASFRDLDAIVASEILRDVSGLVV